MADSVFVAERQTRPGWGGVLASAGLHAIALGVLLVPVARTIDVPPEKSIAVEIVSAAQFAQMLASANAPVLPQAEPEVAVAPRPTTPQIGADGLVHATTLHAAAILDAPDGRKLREELTHVANSERIVQLCGVEGVEQIRTFDGRYDPDMIVAYAMGDTVREGLTLIADGAAFRSARAWYRLKFRCTVMADFSAVSDYAFAIGEAVPRDEWEAHDLTEDEGVIDQP